MNHNKSLQIPFKGTKINYSISGSGPVIIWLHGFLESKHIWNKQQAFFDFKYTNVCIDLLGHGGSGNVSEIHSMALQADAVKNVIQQLKINTFSIIGHSMGGYVGLILLEQLPHKISHFVLLNSTSYEDTTEKKLNRERSISLIQKNKDTFTRMAIVNLFSNLNNKKLQKEIKALIATANTMSKEGVIAALKGMGLRSHKTDVLQQFRGKKLLISGQEDQIIAPKTSTIEAKTTGCELLVLAGGHMSYLESEQELSNYLLLFLK